MILTNNDFKCKAEIEFDVNRLKKHNNFAAQLNNDLESSVSKYIFSSDTRKVVEKENFWKKAGQLLSAKNEIRMIKYY